MRAEDETVVIEMGARYLRVGPAGEAHPQAIMDYGPEGQRRAGDYRRWDNGYEKDWRKRQLTCEAWGEKYELWKLDLRDIDLGLVGDKLERAVREAYTKFLLLDSRPRRLALVLPSILPLPLLSTILDTLFESFQAPTISLLSSPAVTTLAAGLRTALIIDIGWAETVVTGIYEHREVHSERSIRASKWLGQEMLKMLAMSLQGSSAKKETGSEPEDSKYRDAVSFEECEEVVSRMAWCKPLQDTQLSSALTALQLSETSSEQATVSVPLRSTQPPTTLHLPFYRLSEPVESTFFASNQFPHEFDDHDLPLHILIYRTLLHLPLDVRSLCMSRIIFVGSASAIPGLKSRLLSSIQAIINDRGWDPVTGKAVDILKAKLVEKRKKQANSDSSEAPTITTTKAPIITSGEEAILSPQEAAHTPQFADPITAHIHRSTSPPPVHGILRAVDSLGAWSGASLMTSLKITPVSIVERETWMAQGLGGAKKIGEIDLNIVKRQSIGPGGLGRGGDRSSWTLGNFA